MRLCPPTTPLTTLLLGDDHTKSSSQLNTCAFIYSGIELEYECEECKNISGEGILLGVHTVRVHEYQCEECKNIYLSGELTLVCIQFSCSRHSYVLKTYF